MDEPVAVSKVNGIFRYRENQPVVWFREQPSESNCCCPYCGAYVGNGSDRTSNKEHLIGKKFIPSGMSDDGKGFNFIFRACEECNSSKSDIERHVSSITLFRSPARSQLSHVDAIADRKASNDYHPDKQGRRVKDAIEEHQVKMGGLFTFVLVGPPQLNRQYAETLACKTVHIRVSVKRSRWTRRWTSYLRAKSFGRRTMIASPRNSHTKTSEVMGAPPYPPLPESASVGRILGYSFGPSRLEVLGRAKRRMGTSAKGSRSRKRSAMKRRQLSSNRPGSFTNIIIVTGLTAICVT
jgi:hypothetical protein